MVSGIQPLSTLGLAFIFLSSFGNSIYAGNDLRSAGAVLVAVTVCSVLPFFVVREPYVKQARYCQSDEHFSPSFVIGNREQFL